MLSKERFAAALDTLAERFGREASARMVRAYYAILKDEITDDQLDEAVALIYRYDQFWPTPQRFIEAAGAGVSRQVTNAWEHIVESARRGKPTGLADLIGETGVAALKAVGGWSRVAQCDEQKDLPWIRKEFIEEYRRITEDDARPYALPGGAMKAISDGE